MKRTAWTYQSEPPVCPLFVCVKHTGPFQANFTTRVQIGGQGLRGATAIFKSKFDVEVDGSRKYTLNDAFDSYRRLPDSEAQSPNRQSGNWHADRSDRPWL
jgi:hypothetical protein